MLSFPWKTTNSPRRLFKGDTSYVLCVSRGLWDYEAAIIVTKLPSFPTSRRLGLEVVKKTPRNFSTTSLKLPKELPSVEDALKILAAALKAAAEPELDKVEAQRLQVIAKSLSNLFYGLVFLNMSNRAFSCLRVHVVIAFHSSKRISENNLNSSFHRLQRV